MKILAGAALLSLPEVVKTILGKFGFDNILSCGDNRGIRGAGTGHNPCVLVLEEKKGST